MDRRIVLIGVAIAALCVDAAFILIRPEDLYTNLALASCFGAAIYAMYPLIVAHANDHAEPGTYIQVSGGLLLTYGLGAIAGPTVAGFAMTEFGSAGLFWTSASAHVLMIVFTALRIRSRAAVPEERKATFVATPGGKISTPETAALAVGDEEKPATP